MTTLWCPPDLGSSGTTTGGSSRTTHTRSRATPPSSQAFILRRNLAVQFHPELTTTMLAGWLGNGGSEKAASAGLDPEKLLTETRQREEAARVRAHRLVDGFLDGVATRPVVPHACGARFDTSDIGPRPRRGRHERHPDIRTGLPGGQPGHGPGGPGLRLRHRRGGRVGACRRARGVRVWRDVPIAERAKTVKRIGELFVERQAELAAIATEEMGKPLKESRGEAEFCGEIFDYFATEGPELAADQPIKTFSGGKAMVQKLPIGPLLGIMPWNYPFYQIARFAAPNLMLGNTIVLKHAESVPEVRARGGADHEGRRSAGGRLRQRVRHPRPDRADHRRPAHRRRLPDRLGAGGRGRRRDRRQEPQEVRARARRLRPLRHPRHRRRRPRPPTWPGRPGSATPARPATPTSG